MDHNCILAYPDPGLFGETARQSQGLELGQRDRRLDQAGQVRRRFDQDARAGVAHPHQSPAEGIELQGQTIEFGPHHIGPEPNGGGKEDSDHEGRDERATGSNPKASERTSMKKHFNDGDGNNGPG